MFEVRCQECQSPFEVDERRVPRSGMQMRCPKCNTSFLVKRPAGAVAPPPPPPAAKAAPAAGVPRGAPPPSISLSKAGEASGPATLLGSGADLPLPLDPYASLPMPKDLVDLPATRDFSLDLPSVAEPAALPATRDFSLDLPTSVERAELPAVIDFGAGVDPSARRSFPSSAGIPGTPAQGISSSEPVIESFARKKVPTPEYGSRAAQPAPAVSSSQPATLPPDDFDIDEADLPLGPDDDLPIPSSKNLPSAVAAGLPSLAAGLPSLAAGLPSLAAGLPSLAAGLPSLAAGLPAPAAGLPVPSAALPSPSAALPDVLSVGLPDPVDLPSSTEALPAAFDLSNFGAALPAVEPDPLPPVVTSPTMATERGARLGRIGLERKAFTVSANADDLPVLSGGVALPASARSPRSARRSELDPDNVIARKAAAAAANPEPAQRALPVSQFPVAPEFPSLDVAPAPPPPPTHGAGFGELDLGPMDDESDPPSFGFVHPSEGPAPLHDPSLPPLENPFDPTMQSVFPQPSNSMQPAPLSDDLLRAPPMPDSLLPPPQGEFEPPTKGPEKISDKPEKGARFGTKKTESKGPAFKLPFKAIYLAYGALGFAAVTILGGAALALTPYGAFGKNWIDEELHGDERLADANRVVQQVDRSLEHDTYERAMRSLNRLDDALSRVPQVKELQAYIVYANNFVAARFGPDPSRIGRARQVLTQLAEAPPGMRYLNLAKASDALVRGNAREALRLAKLDPAGRDLATLAAERLNDQEQWLRFAQQGRQRHPSPRSRYFLALASQARGDHETARREAEEVLRAETRHAGARILLAKLLARFEPERDRALELLRELVSDGRPAVGARPRPANAATGANPSGASVSERAEACVVAGQIELMRDHVSAAQTRFQRALELDPRSASALVGIGAILYRQGNFADAQARFRNAYSADHANLDAVIGIAQSSLALNQATEAKSIIEPAVHEHPNDGRLHYWLGKALAATTDQRTLAQQAFREAIRLQPENLDAYVSLSELLLVVQRPDAADQVLLEARARVPENAAIHRALAHGRLARGDLPGAEAELRIAVQREPGDIRSHFALGDVLRRMQRLNDAQTEFEFVTHADPNYPGLAMARGLLAEARGELPQALSTFREALARDPTNIELINRVAATLVALGNYGDADQMLRSVVVDQPTNPDAQYIMGRALLGADNFVDAAHYLDRAIELNPQRADFKAYAAEAHRKVGDVQRALQLAEQSIELDPAFPRGYWVRAEIRLYRGDAANALADINRATQLDPRFWAAYATWADIDDALGRRPESIRLYRFAIDHDNRHGDWHYNLGRLLSDAGDVGAARSAFQEARARGAGVTPVPSWYVQATRALADIERDHHNTGAARALYIEYLRLVPQGTPNYNSAALILSDMIHQ